MQPIFEAKPQRYDIFRILQVFRRKIIVYLIGGHAPAAPFIHFLSVPPERCSFVKRAKRDVHFFLTSEEKEPKKTATPKPLHRGFSLFRGKTLSIKVLVWLAKPVPYRASHILLNGALPHIYLIPCLNTEGFRDEQPLRDIIIPPHELCGGISVWFL